MYCNLIWMGMNLAIEIKSTSDKQNILKADELKKYVPDGLMDKKVSKELPHIEGNAIDDQRYAVSDSEREKIELPNINGNDAAAEPHSSIFMSILGCQEVYAPSMEIQAEKIREVYSIFPELHYNKWKLMDIEERNTILNDFEEKIASIELRPSMPVAYEKLSKGVMGYNDGRKIVISEKIMNGNTYSDYKETMNTLFHEGRHSYQNYNLYIKRTESSDEIFNAWVANREKLGYSSGNISFPFNLSETFRQKCYYQYYTQPVEVDARLFAETVENKIGVNARSVYD